MSRDQRVNDNWALVLAQKLALEYRTSLAVCFCLALDFLNAAGRHYDFMLQGLQELEASLKGKNILFSLLSGPPEKKIPEYLEQIQAGQLVTDFDPLKLKRAWKDGVAERIRVPFFEVDAHNIVPCWLASPKQEFGARTFRPKIHRALPKFLKKIPKLKKHPIPLKMKKSGIDWRSIFESFVCKDSGPCIDWIEPGEKAALKALKKFVRHKLASYDRVRNNPVLDGQSNLSPYLHFGQLSAQRAALDVREAAAPPGAKKAFLEELVVRRELSDNFCYTNRHYDSAEGFHPWAKKTLEEHARDKRSYLYSLEAFENAGTHDALWNAAQMEMVKTGKMHGYMRMYWAKKILEWTPGPGEALHIAIYLNDRYELDGRDPNGYAGCAWSIGGVHDRPWFERPVFGKIRYMSEGGCRSKFKVASYIQKINVL